MTNRDTIRWTYVSVVCVSRFCTSIFPEENTIFCFWCRYLLHKYQLKELSWSCVSMSSAHADKVEYLQNNNCRRIFQQLSSYFQTFRQYFFWHSKKCTFLGGCGWKYQKGCVHSIIHHHKSGPRGSYRVPHGIKIKIMCVYAGLLGQENYCVWHLPQGLRQKAYNTHSSSSFLCVVLAWARTIIRMSYFWFWYWTW